MEVRKIAFLQREDIDARDPWYAAREPDPRYNVTSSPCSLSLRPALFQSQGWLRERYEYPALLALGKQSISLDCWVHCALRLLRRIPPSVLYNCNSSMRALYYPSRFIRLMRWRDAFQFPKRLIVKVNDRSTKIASFDRRANAVSLQFAVRLKERMFIFSSRGSSRYNPYVAIWYKSFSVRKIGDFLGESSEGFSADSSWFYNQYETRR